MSPNSFLRAHLSGDSTRWLENANDRLYVIVTERDKLEYEIRQAHPVAKDAGQEGLEWRMTRKMPIKEE